MKFVDNLNTPLDLEHWVLNFNINNTLDLAFHSNNLNESHFFNEIKYISTYKLILLVFLNIKTLCNFCKKIMLFVVIIIFTIKIIKSLSHNSHRRNYHKNQCHTTHIEET
jgi:hypothetical protein